MFNLRFVLLFDFFSFPFCFSCFVCVGRGGVSIYGGGYFEDEIVDSLKIDQRGILAMASRGRKYKEQETRNN